MSRECAVRRNPLERGGAPPSCPTCAATGFGNPWTSRVTKPKIARHFRSSPHRMQPAIGRPRSTTTATWRALAAHFLLLLSFTAMAGAQQTSPILGLRAGERVRIDAPGEVRDHFIGTILFPPADSLLLASSDGPPVLVHPAHITSLEVSRGRSGLGGAIRGLLIGLPVGLVLGFIVGNEPEVQCAPCGVRRRSARDIAMGTLAGATTGALIGAFVGRAVDHSSAACTCSVTPRQCEDR